MYLKIRRAINLERFFIVMEQSLSSLFNFFVVILLSHGSPELVASYGVAFSFSLVISGIFRNSVFTPFITSNTTSSLALIKGCIASSFSLYVSAPILLILMYLSYSGALVFSLPIIFYFFILELVKVTALAKDNMRKIAFFTTFSYLLILLLFYSGYSSFSFLVGSAFVALVFLFFLVLDKGTSEEVVCVGGRDAFILSMSFSIYSHAPLWFLNLVVPGAASLYVQIRSLFQPIQIISRAVDLIEKKNASVSEDYGILRLNNVLTYHLVFGGLGVAFLCAFSLFFFKDLYAVDLNFYSAISVGIYAILGLAMFVSKPIETVFFKMSFLSQLTLSRIIGSIAMLAIFFIGFYISVEYVLIYILFFQAITWMTMLGLNYSQAKKLL
ncbi:hypothetical protein [Bowmanella denitrificans]|uniref:hypothetical protein n=1 Tax=Bowmanella denitrificans TaxID=366582 RepID=UPI000C9B4A5C|nr:hypothetical protein [Bowmanella denitrificans]